MWMAEITKPAREDPSGSNYLSGANASIEFVPVLQEASLSIGPILPHIVTRFWEPTQEASMA